MKNKKKLIIAVIAVILALTLIGTGIYFYLMRYNTDEKDTKELYRQNVASVAYENTIETAYPQTEFYGIIEEHFKSELPEGKTEKKVAIIGFDGCRADILAEIKDGNSGIGYLLENGGSNNLLYCGGVNYPELITQDTSTAPGWCSVLTGVWADKHGVKGNGMTKSLEYKMLMTTLIEENVIDNAAFITK